jgi:AhpD family alkylhydroperoxidase
MSQQTRPTQQEFYKTAAAAVAGITAIGQAVEAAGLEKDLLELLKLRASQINGCAFCVQYHLNVLRKLGVPQEKLDLVAVWREAGIFSARELAAFEWTETLTHVSVREVTDELYARVAAQFPDAQLAHLAVAVGQINLWNRIGVAFRFAPPIPKPAAPAA